MGAFARALLGVRYLMFEDLSYTGVWPLVIRASPFFSSLYYKDPVSALMGSCELLELVNEVKAHIILLLVCS